MRRVTFDIETEGDFRAAGGFDNLQVTVVGAYDSGTGEYMCVTRDELHKLWPIFESADALVGYNSDHFDIPILNRYYAGDLTKFRSIDLLKEIRNVLGRRLKLDGVAEATLGKKKSGNGLEAMKWWAQGEVEKVKSYCLDDVKITDEIYQYALKNKKLRYTDTDGIRDIKLDTKLWEKTSESPALTHTLPF